MNKVVTAFKASGGRLLSIAALATSLALMPAAHAAPLLSGLVAWWNAEGHALDIQGGNDAAIANVGIVAGKNGRAFSFNGTSSEISILQTPNLNLGKSDFTIDAWIRIAEPVPGPQSANAYFPVFFNYAGVPAYMLMVKTQGFKPYFYFRPGDHGTACSPCAFAEATGTTSLNDGKWHHVAGVRRGTSAFIYVDGELRSPVSNDFPAVASVNGGSVDIRCTYASAGVVTIYARIGAIHTGPGNCTSKLAAPGENHFPGLIDEVRVFKRALSDAEIRQLAQWTCPTAAAACPAN